METKEKKMRRFLENICRIPSWNGIFSSEEVDHFFKEYSDLQICNGRLRKVQAKPITGNSIKLYTISAV